MKFHQKILSYLYISAVLLSLFSVNTFAVDSTEKLTLEIAYHNNGEALVGAKFKIYLIATEADNSLEVLEQFKKYNINISYNENTLKALATTLEGYILRDNIKPTDTASVNSKGYAVFPNKSTKLKRGLYLVIGERHIKNGIAYDASPFTVILPTFDSETGVLKSNVKVDVKHNYFDIVSQSKPLTRRVLKAWNDKTNEAQRPKSVEIQLLKDGKLFKTAILSDENNWRYEWSRLSPESTYQIIEVPKDNYTVTITYEGNTCVITNTPKNKLPPSESDNNQTDEKLPQTSVLWWPVPLLLSFGILFLIIGNALQKRDRNE